MRVNADFSKAALVHAGSLEWVASPMAGVHRRMLDRIGDEVARATSIVRYAPGSHFSPHTHGGGEEFLVLEGVFEDEHGAYPAGSYVRNPPTSRHQPGSSEGCVIFVKLWQFHPDDRVDVRVDAMSVPPVPSDTRPGCDVVPLFSDLRETVRIEGWRPGASCAIDASGGAELLVLEGELAVHGERLQTHSWLRIPHAGTLEGKAGPGGARLYVKTGHLAPDVLASAAMPVR
ncbi:MAG: cupin domain-containing protein [Sandaracinaceae bacterium]